MSIPLCGAKYAQPSFFKPSDFLDYMKKAGLMPDDEAPPDAVILSYQRDLYDYVVKHHKVRFHSGYFRNHLAYLEDSGGRVAIAGRFGVGAPAAAAMLEELIAFGARRFVSMGTAGGLVQGLYPGSIVLCTGAIRDEGLSYHYVPAGEPALPAPEITDALGRAFDREGIATRRGLAWTTDAIYRETEADIEDRKKDGAIVVEMEAAALFVVASYRKARLGACFTVSDSLAEPEWKPEFLSEETRAGLEDLYLAALAALGG